MRFMVDAELAEHFFDTRQQRFGLRGRDLCARVTKTLMIAVVSTHLHFHFLCATLAGDANAPWNWRTSQYRLCAWGRPSAGRLRKLSSKRYFCRHTATVQRLPQRSYRRGKTAKSCPLKQSMRRLPSIIKLDQCAFRSRERFKVMCVLSQWYVGARKKPPAHIASPNACDDCHVTSNWTNVRFDHSSVTGSCASCHNGSTATGKPPTHIPSNNICEDCHVTSTWTNVRFDHSATTAQCSTCHNNTTATGKPPTHIASSNTCEIAMWHRHGRMFRLIIQVLQAPVQAATMDQQPQANHRRMCRAPTPAKTVTLRPHGRMCASTTQRQQRNA